MALTTPDMKSCKPKKKCLSGPNEGLAYTPGSECDGGYEFNSVTCDCDPLACCTPMEGSPGQPAPALPLVWRIWGLTVDPYTVKSYGSIWLTCGSNFACPSGLNVGIARYITNRVIFNDPSTWRVELQSIGSKCPTCDVPVTVTYEGLGTPF